MANTRIISTGSYLPKRILSNFDLEKIVDTTDQWILERTGISERRIADENEFTSDLAYQAGLDTLKNIDKDTIDMIIVATTTPDRTFPSVATMVQHKLGIKNNCFAYDIQAVCSGFVYALTIADNFIKAGTIKRALVIGAETMSRIVDWIDRGTCILFGDGAGAVVVEATEEKNGILATSLHSDGQYTDLLYSSGGVCYGQTTGHIVMEGREIFKLAVNKMCESIDTTLKKANLEYKDIDLLVPHQANKRILDGVAKKLGISEDKVIITVDKHGNTSGASIPLALDYAVKNGKIKKDDIIVMEALGGGLTWGSIVIKW